MSQWSGKIPEKNSSQISLAIFDPFGVHMNNFVAHFRNSSKRFVVEILTKNLALNLSGALFLVGLGCSLKWWYKDQLFIALLKQNLPALSESQQKISWETGEYVLKEQNLAVQQLDNKHPLLRTGCELVELPSEGGQKFLDKVASTHALYDKANQKNESTETSTMLPSHPKSGYQRGGGKDKSFMHFFNLFDLQERTDDENIPYVLIESPAGGREKAFHRLLERVDLYMNHVVVKFKPPWQKHAYHRFVGIFSEPTQVKGRKIDPNHIKGIETSVDNEAWFAYPSDSFALHLSNAQHLCSASESKSTDPSFIDSTLAYPKDQQIVNNERSELVGLSSHGGQKFLDKSLHSQKFIDFFQKENRKFSTYTIWKPLFPETWFKLSAHSLYILNEEFPHKSAVRVLDGNREFLTCFRKPIVCSLIKDLSVPNNKYVYSTILGTKLTRLRAILGKSEFSPLENESINLSAMHTEEVAFRMWKNKSTLLKKLSYPLELTKLMAGWQPPGDALILNSYLDEIPYKLESALPPLLTKKPIGNQIIHHVNIDTVNSQRDIQQIILAAFCSRSSWPSFRSAGKDRKDGQLLREQNAAPLWVSKLVRDFEGGKQKVKGQQTLSEEIRRKGAIKDKQQSEGSKPFSSAFYPSDYRAKYHNSLHPLQVEGHQHDDTVKSASVGGSSFNKKGQSETFLRKSQFLEMKQLLKNELQFLINTLPLFVVDKSLSNEHNDLGTNLASQPLLASFRHPLDAKQSTEETKEVQNKEGGLLRMLPSVCKDPLHTEGSIEKMQNVEGHQDQARVSSKMSKQHFTRIPKEDHSQQDLLIVRDGGIFGSNRPSSISTDFSAYPKGQQQSESLNPLFLLNNLGFTFNNLSSLNSPPMLVPVNSDASFWMWKFPISAKSKYFMFKQKFPSSKNNLPASQAPYLLFRHPKKASPLLSEGELHRKDYGADKQVKGCFTSTNNTIFKIYPESLTWEIFQQPTLHYYDQPASVTPSAVHSLDAQDVMQRRADEVGIGKPGSISGSASFDPTDSKEWEAKLTERKPNLRSANMTELASPLSTGKKHSLLSAGVQNYNEKGKKLRNSINFSWINDTHKLFLQQKKTTIANMDFLNPVDKGVNVATYGCKRSRFMSGYVYPDTQSQLLRTNLYQWLAKNRTKISQQWACLALPHSKQKVDKNQQNEMYWFFYPESLRGVNRLIDDACLSNIDIPITPTTFFLRFFQKQDPFALHPSFGWEALRSKQTFYSLHPKDVQDVQDSQDKNDRSRTLASPLDVLSGFTTISRASDDPKERIALPYEKFNHHLAFFPGFSKPGQFFDTLSQAEGISQDSELGSFSEASLHPVHFVHPKNAMDVTTLHSAHDRKQPPLFGIDVFTDCNARGTAYRGIGVQRNKLTKDLQPFSFRSEGKETLGQSSTWGILLLGPENPLTDRQCHFFGQKQLSTLDTNSFQRDYLRQLGKEIVTQSNARGFTEKLPSIERAKILSFSKTVNSFFFKKRKYTYLLEKKDQWHLLFQEQLRTATEDTRKYPPLTPEETKNHGPGRIQVSAPLIMARFPKTKAKIAKASLPHLSIDATFGMQGVPELQHGLSWRPFCYVESSRLLTPSVIDDNNAEGMGGVDGKKPSLILAAQPHLSKEARHSLKKPPWDSFALHRNESSKRGSLFQMTSCISVLPSDCKGTAGRMLKNKQAPDALLSISNYGWHASAISSPSDRSEVSPLEVRSQSFASHRGSIATPVLDAKQRSFPADRKDCQDSIFIALQPLSASFQSEATDTFRSAGKDRKIPMFFLKSFQKWQLIDQLRKANKTIHHYPLLSERQDLELNHAPWLNNTFSKGRNSFPCFNQLRKANNLQWLIQEPLTANSWAVISQWFFLVALLFWIEQMLSENVFPALFALEQVLLGATGIRTGDRTHVIRVSNPSASNTPKFQDLAGVDGLLGELSELVLFLRGHKERFWNKKGSYGVLLTGPPGAGKTFLVRALANEARVPVLILSAGTLVANKLNNNKPSWSIRHAFRRAKQLAPCILFIDEIDALGKSRGKIVTDIDEIVVSAFPSFGTVSEAKQTNLGSSDLPTPNQNQSTIESNTLSSKILSYEQSWSYGTGWPSVSKLLLNEWEHPLNSTILQESNEINRCSLCEEEIFDLVKTKGAKTLASQSPPSLSSGSTQSQGTSIHGYNQEKAKQSRSAHSNADYVIHDPVGSGKDSKRKFGPLTQLLVSMDGVSNLSGVLIMGATNRPELLDSALTRPGRFERIIRVEKPSEQKRIEILQLYSRNLGVQHQIPWHYLANRTRGLTAADLAVAMNYSSLKAIIHGSAHTIETIEYGLNSITRFFNTPSGRLSSKVTTPLSK